MAIRRHTVTVTTASGTGTGYTSENINGLIHQIQYVKNDYSNGVDFTITGNETGQNIWTQADVNASVTVAPRQPVSDQAGVASLYAAAGEPIEDRIAIGNEKIKIAIAQGGTAKSGTFHILVES